MGKYLKSSYLLQLELKTNANYCVKIINHNQYLINHVLFHFRYVKLQFIRVLDISWLVRSQNQYEAKIVFSLVPSEIMISMRYKPE